jgi:hypothetical protein
VCSAAVAAVDVLIVFLVLTVSISIINATTGGISSTHIIMILLIAL